MFIQSPFPESQGYSSPVLEHSSTSVEYEGNIQNEISCGGKLKEENSHRPQVEGPSTHGAPISASRSKILQSEISLKASRCALRTFLHLNDDDLYIFFPENHKSSGRCILLWVHIYVSSPQINGWTIITSIDALIYRLVTGYLSLYSNMWQRRSKKKTIYTFAIFLFYIKDKLRIKLSVKL